MAYDEQLAERFRDALSGRLGITEKRMMGGVCFFINGNMIGAVNRPKDGAGRFMFRVGKDNEAEALSRQGARIVEHGNRRLGGFVHVDETACDAAAATSWLELALSYVAALPPK